jgi:hypothetical protein
LIRERLDLIDLVQKVCALLHLIRKKLEEDVEQTRCVVNSIKGLPHLHESFATLDVQNVVVRQIKADDGHGLLDKFLVFF